MLSSLPFSFKKVTSLKKISFMVNAIILPKICVVILICFYFYFFFLWQIYSDLILFLCKLGSESMSKERSTFCFEKMILLCGPQQQLVVYRLWTVTSWFTSRHCACVCRCVHLHIHPYKSHCQKEYIDKGQQQEKRKTDRKFKHLISL